MTVAPDLTREIRVMHACEIGASGVYRGHKCAARYFYRSTLASLDKMRAHEASHAGTFEALLDSYGGRRCAFSGMWFWGGLLYGVAIGLLGLRAIGSSTATIERVVDLELTLAIERLASFPDVVSRLREIQGDERHHASYGAHLAGASDWRSRIAAAIAYRAAYTAKAIAERT